MQAPGLAEPEFDCERSRVGVAKEWDFCSWIDSRTGRFGDRVAVASRSTQGWIEMTYEDLRREARAFGGWLIERGIQRGEAIAVLGEPGPEWAIAFFGIVFAGATVVPVDVRSTAKELDSIVHCTQPTLIVSSCSRAALAKSFVGRSPVEEVVMLDDDAIHGESLVLADLKPRRGHEPRVRGREEVAVLVYTSGTTGNAKVVETTFGNLLFELDAVTQTSAVRSDDRFLSVLPLNHLFELVCGFLVPLNVGATVDYVNAILPEDVMHAMRERRATSIVGVPLFYRALKRSIEARIADLPAASRRYFEWALAMGSRIRSDRVRRLLSRPIRRALGGELCRLYCGGASLDRAVERFFHCLGMPIVQGYGLTEASPVVAMNAPGQERIGSVGRPLAGVEVRIVEDANGEGEIVTRGPHVMRGYLGRPELTRSVVDGGGWLHTGDLGFIDEQGFLHVTGRSKDMIVLDGGKKVHPDDVEEVISDACGAAEICVVSVSRTPSSSAEEVCVVVVPHADVAHRYLGDAGGLQAEMERRVRVGSRPLATFQRPTRVVVCEQPLPRTALKKVKRREVRSWVEAQTGAAQ